MRYWLVGTPAPGSDYRETMGEGGSLSGLEQSGWTVRYDRIRLHVKEGCSTACQHASSLDGGANPDYADTDHQ
jgi:outer membrane biogenesis lipoprotein LolB